MQEERYLKYTIVISSDSKVKKITKIFTYSDGGFAVAVPYHAAKSGYLTKMQVDYGRRLQHVTALDDYTASDKVKLSMHIDGFVQFSGENPGRIISGKDSDGKPKGLGYYTSPLTKPIKTGPTFALIFWGLDDFLDYNKVKANETKLEFRDSDIYYRDLPSECNGYAIEGFVFPREYFSGVREDQEGNLFLDLCFRTFEASGAVFKIRVLPTECNNYFIGLLVSKVKSEFQQQSGFVLNAPSELKDPKSNIGTVMNAIYPKPIGIENKKSLDYLKVESEDGINFS
jgi:hypothetical protein